MTYDMTSHCDIFSLVSNRSKAIGIHANPGPQDSIGGAIYTFIRMNTVEEIEFHSALF